MDRDRFDNLTKLLARRSSRRVALGSLSLLGATVVGGRVARGAQILPVATCAAEGAPCIMLVGCCTGLTCVTNAINPNLGVCQSGGTGGVVVEPPAVGGTADAQTASAAPTPDPTPKVRETHTPGDNKRVRSAVDLSVGLQCGNDLEIVEIHNRGTEPVSLAKFVSNSIPDASGESQVPNNRTVRPGRSVYFYNGTGTGPKPASALPWYTSTIFGGNGSLDVVTTGNATFSGSCGANIGTGRNRRRRQPNKGR